MKARKCPHCLHNPCGNYATSTLLVPGSVIISVSKLKHRDVVRDRKRGARDRWMSAHRKGNGVH